MINRKIQIHLPTTTVTYFLINYLLINSCPRASSLYSDTDISCLFSDYVVYSLY